MPVKPLRNLQSKVADETYDLYEQTLENSECTSRGAFVELLLESFLNPKTKPVEVVRPSADQLQEVQLLNNQIGELQTALGFKENEINQAEETRLQLLQQIAELQNRQPEPGQFTPAPGQELITIPPIVRLVLDTEIALAKKKTGKEFNYSEYLLDFFWTGVEEERVYPLYSWSKYHLSKLKKQIESQA